MRFMVAVTACLALAGPAEAQQRLSDVDNSPGLRCWGIRGGPSAQVYVFAGPDTITEKLSHVSSWVAVTGPVRNGFLPTETTNGPRGWVTEESVERDRWLNMNCAARRNECGRISFAHGLAPSSR
ncbi:Hypothetical protein RADP37_04566 (plasmid) [Roseomonas mucosa]|uniref:SH3b domain-containing protein n=2 Tax=Roseomonas mucosa TaxID=207340 RepID=A0A4Y1MRP0_9PROT|nr:hypothetical protein [Roseomonas mucosa]AWV20293.1 Hypothetical protein RADP37_04566 [Roseomonas mucosa]QDD97102.1 Hypothetical protein ADP8_04566a [Roseomonas mucosa]